MACCDTTWDLAVQSVQSLCCCAVDSPSLVLSLEGPRVRGRAVAFELPPTPTEEDPSQDVNVMASLGAVASLLSQRVVPQTSLDGLVAARIKLIADAEAYLARQYKAALRIQAVFRGKLARRKIAEIQKSGSTVAIAGIKKSGSTATPAPTPLAHLISLHCMSPPTHQDPAWRASDFFREDLGIVVNKAFLPEEVQANERLELPWLRALGALAPSTRRAVIRQALMENEVVQKIVNMCDEKVVQLCTYEKAEEELNTKFAESYAFTMVHGGPADFSGGLESRIGVAIAPVLQAICAEHLAAVDSGVKFHTTNYGIETDMKTEFGLVGWEAVTELKASPTAFPNIWCNKCTDLESALATAKISEATEWPGETKEVKWPRVEHRAKRILEVACQKNQLLESLRQVSFHLEEVLMLRLYTGPAFKKYNAVLRGGALDESTTSDYLRDQFKKICGGPENTSLNRYPTSIAVLSAGLVKASKFTKAQFVYRGLPGGSLPRAFWEAGPDGTGIRGGVEFGFLSTTADREVAYQYATRSDAKTLIEADMSLHNRGAHLGWLSQYPFEDEICFPPLTALQVVSTRMVGSVLFVTMSFIVNTNLKSYEDIMGSRLKFVAALCNSIRTEIATTLESCEDWNVLLKECSAGKEDDAKKQVIAWANNKLSVVEGQPAERYNKNELFLQALHDAVGISDAIRQRHAEAVRSLSPCK